MEDEFDVLAVRVLAVEATTDELARLQEMLDHDPALRTQFAELRATWAGLKTAGPLAEAINEKPMEPPPERLREWQKTLATKFPLAPGRAAPPPQAQQTPSDQAGFRSLWSRLIPSRVAIGFAIGCLIAAAVTTTVLLSHRAARRADSAPVAYLLTSQGGAEVHRGGKRIAAKGITPLARQDEIILLPRVSAVVIASQGAKRVQGPQSFKMAQIASREWTTNETLVNRALFEPAKEIPGLLVVNRGGRSIRVYSPVGVTGSLTPPLLWSNESGKTYDLWLTDEFNPQERPFQLKDVAPPVDFSKAWPGRRLGANGLYRLKIAEAGKPFTVTELTFRTSSQPIAIPSGPPAEKLLSAYEMLTSDPPRVGDALAQLLSLSPDIASSQLVLRLKIAAFGQLGYKEDFDQALAQLQNKNF